jgi:DNA end-binding protein Ku
VAEAVKLIEAMSRDFEPDSYEDRYRSRLLQLVEDRRRNKKAKLPTIEEPEAEPAPDLMAALKASLERVRQTQ